MPPPSTTGGASPARRALACAAIAWATTGCLYPPIPAEFEAGSADGAQTTGDGGGAIPVFNNCDPTMFVDRTAQDADRTVGFGGVGGSDTFAFAPPCITVAAGQSVVFNGSFSIHPLSPGTSPAATGAGTGGNPIPRTASGDSLTVAFPAAGTYPYFCEMHYATGMAGVVNVQ